MTAEKEYLIYLLSCFLNGKVPEGREVNWEEIYRLADINDICGIVQNEIMLLPVKYRPCGETKSKFTQQIGYAVRTYEIKCSAIEHINKMLNDLKIDHMFVKGAVIKELYPVKELRTSGDIDIIIGSDDFYGIYHRVKNKNIVNLYNIYDVRYNHFNIFLKYNDVFFELHRDADLLNSYFDDIFLKAESDGKNEYYLSDYNHLLFVLLHLIKHLKLRGAGIRMLMDIDVIIRSIDGFNETVFTDLCKSAGVENTAKVILSFCNYCFNTPVSDSVDIKNITQLTEKLAGVFLEGGSFGFETESLGLFHYHYNISENDKLTKAKKIKALLRYLFPPVAYVREYNEYSMKYPVLIPFAYVLRIFKGIFKRRNRSIKTINEIMNITSEDLAQKKILKELDFDSKEK